MISRQQLYRCAKLPFVLDELDYNICIVSSMVVYAQMR
jgi:hypothetical protein